LLNDACWLVIDDYFGLAKAAPCRAQVNVLVSEGRLLPFGYYGWGAWVGQWRASSSLRAKQKGPHLPRLPKLLCALADKKRYKEPPRLESQHSFLPCTHRNLFHPPLQAACRPSFNSRRRPSAPLVPCAI